VATCSKMNNSGKYGFDLNRYDVGLNKQNYGAVERVFISKDPHSNVVNPITRPDPRGHVDLQVSLTVHFLNQVVDTGTELAR
jgi:hypothetical protein